MYDSDLITLFKTLTAKEVRSFDKHLSTTYRNSKQEIKLYRFLKPYYPQFDHLNLEKDRARVKLFGRHFSKEQFNNLSSILKKKIESFLLNEENQKNYFKQSLHLLKIYRERNLSAFVTKKEKELKNKLASFGNRSTSYYSNSLLFYHELYFHHHTDKIDAREYLYEANKNLEKLYLLSKLKYITEIQFRNTILNEAYLTEEFHEIKKIQIQEEDVVIKMYWKIILLLLDDKNSDFESTQNYINNHYKLEEPKDQVTLFNFLLNYIISKLKTGDLTYANKLQAIYSSLLNISIEQNGSISTNTYLNAIYTITRFKNFESAKSILRNYTSHVPKEEQAEALNFAWLFFYFEKGEFQKAEKYLEKIKTLKKQAFHLKIRAKALELMILVEMNGDAKHFQSLCENFEKYLRRQKKHFGDSNVEGGLNFIKLIKQLYLDEKDTFYLKAKIKQLDFLIHKSWLLEKLNDPYFQ